MFETQYALLRILKSHCNFQGLAKLKFLDIVSTKLSVLKPGVFDTLPLLKRIDLRFNNIKAIPSGLFSKNSDLVYIFLENNPLLMIDNAAFDPIPNLLSMHIENTQLPAAGTYKCKTIYLNNNKLKSMYVSEASENIEIQFNEIEMINCTDKNMSVTRIQVINDDQVF